MPTDFPPAPTRSAPEKGPGTSERPAPTPASGLVIAVLFLSLAAVGVVLYLLIASQAT